MATNKLHGEHRPTLLETPEAVREYLGERACSAQVSGDRIEPYIEAVRDGKVLLVDRVLEDDALQVISTLEGTRAECVQTLPPEPDSAQTVTASG